MMANGYSVSVDVKGQIPTVRQFLAAQAALVHAEDAPYRSDAIYGLRYPNDIKRHNVIATLDGKHWGSGFGGFVAQFKDEDTAQSFALEVQVNAKKKKTLVTQVKVLKV